MGAIGDFLHAGRIGKGDGGGEFGGGEDDVGIEGEDAAVRERLLDAVWCRTELPRAEGERGERIRVDELGQGGDVPLSHVYLGGSD